MISTKANSPMCNFHLYSQASGFSFSLSKEIVLVVHLHPELSLAGITWWMRCTLGFLFHPPPPRLRYHQFHAIVVVCGIFRWFGEGVVYNRAPDKKGGRRSKESSISLHILAAKSLCKWYVTLLILFILFTIVLLMDTGNYILVDYI